MEKALKEFKAIYKNPKKEIIKKKKIFVKGPLQRLCIKYF